MNFCTISQQGIRGSHDSLLYSEPHDLRLKAIYCNQSCKYQSSLDLSGKSMLRLEQRTWGIPRHRRRRFARAVRHQSALVCVIPHKPFEEMQADVTRKHGNRHKLRSLTICWYLRTSSTCDNSYRSWNLSTTSRASAWDAQASFPTIPKMAKLELAACPIRPNRYPSLEMPCPPTFARPTGIRVPLAHKRKSGASPISKRPAAAPNRVCQVARCLRYTMTFQA